MPTYGELLEKRLTCLRKAEFAVKELQADYKFPVEDCEYFINYLTEEIEYVLHRMETAKKYMIDN